MGSSGRATTSSGGGASDSDGRAGASTAPGGANDDEFSAASIDASWSEVKHAGLTDTFFQKYGRMWYRHKATGTALDLHALLKHITPAVGDYIETAFMVQRLQTTDAGIGLIMSDGNTFGAGKNVAAWVFSTNCRLISQSGFSGAQTNLGQSSFPVNTSHDILYMRLKYEAANTWGLYVSGDGIEWFTVVNNAAFTMTPTYVGIVYNNFDNPAVPGGWWSWLYFRYNPAND